jgi:hypothetical protein
MTRTTLLTVAIVAVAAACDSSPTVPSPTLDRSPLASRGGGSESGTPAAWGSGTLVFGATVEKISFNAEQTTPTLEHPFAARGEADFNDKTAHVRGHIRINCLNVVGNTATLSGIITESNDETIEGFEAVFQVVDNDVPGQKDKKSQDFASPILLHAVGTGSDCATGEFDLVPFKGSVEVQPEIGS